MATKKGKSAPKRLHNQKLSEALDDLARSIKAYVPTKPGKARSLSFLALSKAFEVALEYSWKHLKVTVEEKGLEAFSPKDAIREAAKLSLISNAELWLKSVNARNLSVHDYFSMSEEDFVSLVKEFERVASGDLL